MGNLNLKMKFVALFATIVAVVLGDKCDPKAYHAKFYTDANCTKDYEPFNKKYGSVTAKDLKYWKGGCINVKGDGFKMFCNAKGFHEVLFKDKACTTKMAKFDFAWDTCEKVPMANKYVIVSTTQKFKK